MEFKKFSVSNYSYGETSPNVDLEAHKRNGITNVNFSDPIFENHMNDYQSENYPNIHRYLEILSVCHTVITEKSKNSQNPDHLAYNASSPDELALVNAAKFFGYYFKGRDDDNNMIVEMRGQDDDLGIGTNTKQFQLLNVIEFTSLRKRMTVIVRSQQDSSIRVMCKGADSIILPRLRAGQNILIQRTQDFLDSFSKEGLRTLVIAEKIITDEEYHAWNKNYQNALVATANREEKVNAIAD
jgi:phospholipid-transporting ATPase